MYHPSTPWSKLRKKKIILSWPPSTIKFSLLFTIQVLELLYFYHYRGGVVSKPPKPLKAFLPHTHPFFLHSPPNHSLCSVFWNGLRKRVCNLYKFVYISQISSLSSVDFWTIVKYWTTCRLIEKKTEIILVGFALKLSERGMGHLWFREAFWIQVIEAGKLIN